LTRWRTHCGTLPVHDLLDRIYFEGDLEARYAAAVPEAMRPQVAANLRAFMQLALTQDAGRYPTLAGFVRELASLIDDADAAPGEGLAADAVSQLRSLHAAGDPSFKALSSRGIQLAEATQARVWWWCGFRETWTANFRSNHHSSIFFDRKQISIYRVEFRAKNQISFCLTNSL
jgi:hypothetical protein